MKAGLGPNSPTHTEFTKWICISRASSEQLRIHSTWPVQPWLEVCWVVRLFPDHELQPSGSFQEMLNLLLPQMFPCVFIWVRLAIDLRVQPATLLLSKSWKSAFEMLQPHPLWKVHLRPTNKHHRGLAQGSLVWKPPKPMTGTCVGDWVLDIITRDVEYQAKWVLMSDSWRSGKCLQTVEATPHILNDPVSNSYYVH